MQVSALEQEPIEVDPDTKEMLKVLVSFYLLKCFYGYECWCFSDWEMIFLVVRNKKGSPSKILLEQLVM